MNKINSIEEILQQIAKIRGLREGFITNFYLDLFKHSIWIKENVLHYECIEDGLFIIKKNDDGFWNVFYCSTNQEELEKAIKIFVDKYNEETLMFDIVGNNDYCIKITDVFKRCQCKEYCSLVRMERMITEIDYDVSFEKVTYVTKEQAKEVLSLLNENFDVRTEQIPFLEELEEYAKQNHIIIYQDGDKIIGFVIFEKNRTTLYLRYWFVNHQYRDQKIGSKLLHKFFEEGKDTKRQLLWVIQDNDNAIKRYKHYGFKEENMFDYVFSNKNISYINK